MTNNSDIIILNGKHFNAMTGKPVAAGTKTGKLVRNVDGILPKHVTGTVLKRPAQYEPAVKSVQKKPIMDIVRVPAHAIKRSQQPGQTLMRRAVAKPMPTLKRTTKITAAIPAVGTIQLSHVAPKISAALVDAKKLHHAQKISKNSLITRFSVEPSATARRAVLSPAASHAVVSSQKAITGLAKQPSMDIFERALARAESHNQITPPHVKHSRTNVAKRRRRLNLAATSFACLLVTGFIGYQNLANVKLQYASSRAGFHAALPSYQPAGFSVGQLTYQTGAVSVNYHSNSDDRAFAIMQRPSAWDSQALRDNFVASNGEQYHVAVSGGRTIYLYGDNNATWVNGGVWYQVQAGNSLNERQLTQLASSM